MHSIHTNLRCSLLLVTPHYINVRHDQKILTVIILLELLLQHNDKISKIMVFHSELRLKRDYL